jgi:CO/xanthine dehydrogenase FAD-binding subunit
VRGDAATATLLRPRSPSEALRLLVDTPDALPLAGGTDLMVSWNAGALAGRTFVDLTRLTAWSRVRSTKAALIVGSLVTHATLVRHEVVRRRFPLLAAAAATVGGPQIQNRGTLGGNIANASPAGDTFPPLLVYGAWVRAVSAVGVREIPLEALFAGPKRTTLARGELIESIVLPFERKATRELFRKVGTRAAQAISKTVVSGRLWLRPDGVIDELRFALGSMAPTARRLPAVEAYVRGKRPTEAIIREACARVAEDVTPIDDVRSTAAYRLAVSRNLLASLLRSPHR